MSTEEVKGRPLADDERADIERLLNTYGRLRFGAQISGIYYPAEVATNDGKVRNWQGHVVADTNGHEAMTDFLAFCLTHDFGPIVRRLLAENDRLKADIATLKILAAAERDEVQQILARALGYPKFSDDPTNFPDATEADGVCVGDQVAASLAEQAAKEIGRLKVECESLEISRSALRKQRHDLSNEVHSYRMREAAEGR